MIKKILILGLLLLAPSAHASFQLLTAISADAPATASNRSLMPVGESAWSINTVNVTCLVMATTTLTNLRVVSEVAPDNGAGTQSYVFSLVKIVGGLLQTSALTATLSETDTTVNDLVNSATIYPGESFYYKSAPSGTPASLTRVSISVLANGVIPKQLFQCGTSDQASIGLIGATEYISPFMPYAPVSAEGSAEVVMPASGTISGMKITLGSAPDNGAGTQGYTFTFRKNTAATSVTCSITETSEDCSDSSNSFAYAAGDRVALQYVKTGSPLTAILTGAGSTLIPDTDGQFPIFANSWGTNLSSTDARYTPIMGGVLATTETAVDEVSQALTLKNIYVYLNGCITTLCLTQVEEPFASYSFSNKVDGVSNALNCLIVGSGGTLRSCNATTDITVTAGDLLNTHIIPSNAPIVRRAAISYLGAITQLPRRRW